MARARCCFDIRRVMGAMVRTYQITMGRAYYKCALRFSSTSNVTGTYLSELRRDFLASVGITYAVFRIAKSRLRASFVKSITWFIITPRISGPRALLLYNTTSKTNFTTTIA